MLFTTIHQISEELKRRPDTEGRARTYSYAQIREGLQVLAKTKIHLRSEGDDDLIFSPIADLGTFSDKSRKHHADIGNATLYVRFNSLISQAVLSRSWRQINYERIIGTDQFLARWFRKQLSLRFVYAAPSKSYNINLSTVIESAGVALRDRLSDNLKQVEQALASLTDIVARYSIAKEFTVHKASGRGRVLADAKIVIRPTEAFVSEQILTNLHEHRLDDAVVTDEGAVMLEPRQKDFPGFNDYHRAKSDFASARKIKNPQ